MDIKDEKTQIPPSEKRNAAKSDGGLYKNLKMSQKTADIIVGIGSALLLVLLLLNIF